MRLGRRGAFPVAAFLLIALAPQLAAAAPVDRGAVAAPCASSLGPGIAPPASVPSGIPGFHATWYGQSGYPTLCAGQRITATVAFYNSGSRGWVLGRETAMLGKVAVVGSDGRPLPDFPADPGWPAPDRVAVQPAAYVGPGDVAWFQFSVTAPTAPGRYRFYIRPLIEGVEWMEDEGVYWELNVVGSRPDVVAVLPPTRADGVIGSERSYTAVSSDGTCLDLALVAETDVRSDGSLADVAGRAKLTTAGAVVVAGASTAPYVSCVAAGTDHLIRFTMRATAASDLRPVAFQDLNNNDALDVATESFALGGPVRAIPADADRGPHLVTAGVVDLDRHFIIDTLGAATYHYDQNDAFVRNGNSMTVGWFQQLISRGDVLNVLYESDPGASSTFTFLEDFGRRLPAVTAVLDSWDGGVTQNDVGITITELPSNVDGIAYPIERALAVYSATCDGSAGAYNQIASVTTVGDDKLYVDRDLPVGAYCYRVSVADLLTAETSFAYTSRLVVMNPPAAVVRPRSTDARLAVSAGSPALIDTGDVIRLAFDKPMAVSPSGIIRLMDADGTTAEVRCGVEATCTVNASTDFLGGVVYPAARLITLELHAAPRVLVTGSVAGLGAPATVIAGDFRDFAGNAWDVSVSDDIVVGTPD
jgi:hypothetical protein